MNLSNTSTLSFVKIFARTTRDLIKSSTGVSTHVSKTALRVSGVHLTGDIGAFVGFSGDYNGIMILNFDGEAALELVSGYLTTLGLGPEDVPKFYMSDEVRNNVGELTNQIIGKCRSKVEEEMDISAKANIPAVVPITVPIGLSMVSKAQTDLECVRICFTTAKRNKFHMELALEPVGGEPLNI